MIIPNELINNAKEEYGEQAIPEIVDYFQIDNYDEKAKSCSCPLGHTDNTPSFIWNNKNSCFHCFSCGKNFGILDLYLMHGMTYLESVKKLFENTKTHFSFSEFGIKSKSIKYPSREFSEDRSKVEHYLAMRKISKATLDYCDVQQDKHNNIVFHFYDNNDILGLVKYRPSHKINKEEENKKKNIKTWCQKDAVAIPILFNMNRIDTTKPLIITERRN